MPLVDTEIRKALDSGAWKAYRDGSPIGFADLTVGPNSVDCSLGAELLEIHPRGLIFGGVHVAVDPRSSESFGTTTFKMDDDGFLIHPGRLYLASVRESFDCSAGLTIGGITSFFGGSVPTYFAPMIDGRSTMARVGLSVHNTAGFGDYGFDGQFTLEISCLLPIVLYPGMRIAQISFHELTGSPTQRYSGAYTGQTGPRPAVLGEGRI